MFKKRSETFYEILGIDESASEVVIQEAFSKLKNFSLNQPCSSKLQEAYETLMDPISREAYDAHLAEDELQALTRSCRNNFSHAQSHFERDYLIPDLPFTQKGNTFPLHNQNKTRDNQNPVEKNPNEANREQTERYLCSGLEKKLLSKIMANSRKIKKPSYQ